MWDFIKGIEELTAEQRKEMRTALESAFPEPQNLELMIYDEFGISFKAITQGQANYQLDLQKLVQWAESQGKLPRLLEKASKSNPGNPKLNKLCKKWCPDYISYSQKEKLKEIITGIESKKINEIARQVIDQYNPNIIIDHYPNFNNYSLDRIIDILLENSLDKENNLLLKWVGYLCQDDKIKQPILEQLQDWLKTVDPSFDVLLLKPLTKKQSDLNEKTSYLMVSLAKNQSNNKILMNAWLLPDETNPKYPIPLDDNEEQKGVECTWDEAACVLAKFIRLSYSYLDSKDPYNLIIELFLPWEYLGEQIYRWEIEEDIFGESVALISKYIVVVRSYDRFNDPQLKNELNKKWEYWKSFFTDQRSEKEIMQKFEHLDDINIESKKLKLKLEEEKKLGVKAIGLSQAKNGHKEMFKAILRAGIPFAIWAGCESFPEQKQKWEKELEKLLNYNSLMNLNIFFKDIKIQYWEAAYSNNYPKESLGSNLHFLCDNPERMPSFGNQPLRPTGK